jgi:hypothetical protein
MGMNDDKVDPRLPAASLSLPTPCSLLDVRHWLDAIDSITPNFEKDVGVSSTAAAITATLGAQTFIPLTVVQSIAAATYPINFTNPVTAGNTVVLLSGAANLVEPPPTPQISGPTLGGVNVAGAYPIWNQGGSYGILTPGQAAGGVFAFGWVLPNCPAGNGIDFTLKTPGYVDGAVAYEVHGLGPTPVVDAVTSATGNGTAVTSGASPVTRVAPAFVVGTAVGYGQVLSAPGGGFSGLPTSGDNYAWGGYQIANTSGLSYTWAQTGAAIANWAAGVASIVHSK